MINTITGRLRIHTDIFLYRLGKVFKIGYRTISNGMYLVDNYKNEIEVLETNSLIIDTTDSSDDTETGDVRLFASEFNAMINRVKVLKGCIIEEQTADHLGLNLGLNVYSEKLLITLLDFEINPINVFHTALDPSIKYYQIEIQHTS